MSAPKHTPGDWQWWTICSCRRLRSDLGHGKTADILMPCVLKDGQPDIVVSSDDMNLIVAAPAMLTALQAQEAADKANEGRAGYGAWQKLEDAAKALRVAAIAKATGAA